MAVYFPHSDWPTNPSPGNLYNFTRDVRPSAGDMIWEFDADSSAHPPYYAKLTWDVSQVPSSYNVVRLVDTWNTPTAADDTIINMRTATEYIWAGADVRRFQFRISIGPSVQVTYPNGGEIVAGTISANATAFDPNGTVTQVAFDYSGNGGTTWNPIGADANGTDGWSVPWDTRTVADGSNYRIGPPLQTTTVSPPTISLTAPSPYGALPQCRSATTTHHRVLTARRRSPPTSQIPMAR